MTVKSIVDVEINDAAFQKFKDAFADYQKLLAATPPDWKKTTDGVDSSVSKTEDLVEATEEAVEAARELGFVFNSNVVLLQQHNEIMDSLDKKQPRIRKETEEQAKSWRDMARDAKQFAASVGSATVSLLRWAEVTGAVSGLVGVGGLFGIERLAYSTSNQRKLAGGTGTTIGERSAFETNFGRLLDNPTGFLTGVFESLTDVTKAAPYGALGLDYNTERRRGPADASLDVLRGLKSLADRTPEEQLGTTFASRQLSTLGLTLEDFQRIKSRPLSELEEETRRYDKDRGDLDIKDPRAKAWEDLNVQLDRAGKLIKNTLIDGLTPLTPIIADLSETVANALRDFLTGGAAREAIDSLQRGFVWLDDTFKDPKFRDHVRSFVDDVVTLAEGVGAALHRVAGWFGGGASPGAPHAEPPAAPGAPAAPGVPFGPDLYDPTKPKGDSDVTPGPFMDWLNGLLGYAGRARPHERDDAPPPGFMDKADPFSPIAYRPGGGRAAEAHDFFRAAGWDEAQTDGLLGNINAESGFNPFARNASGHQGIAQWDRDRSARFRSLFGHDPSAGTFEEQLVFVQYELTHDERAAGDALRRLGKDPGSAAAAVDRYYERSEGTTTAARAAAASGYMQQFKDRSVRVIIQNNTGGSVNVTATQMSA